MGWGGGGEDGRRQWAMGEAEKATGHCVMRRRDVINNGDEGLR